MIARTVFGISCQFELGGGRGDEVCLPLIMASWSSHAMAGERPAVIMTTASNTPAATGFMAYSSIVKTRTMNDPGGFVNATNRRSTPESPEWAVFPFAGCDNLPQSKW